MLWMNAFNADVMLANLVAWCWTGNLWTGYWYDSPNAIGNQMYPNGVHLFYDMYSVAGLAEFAWEWFWLLLWNVLAVLTLGIPIDLMVKLGEEGMDPSEWTSMWYKIGFAWPAKWFAIETLCGKVFKCEVDAGWYFVSGVGA